MSRDVMERGCSVARFWDGVGVVLSTSDAMQSDRLIDTIHYTYYHEFSVLAVSEQIMPRATTVCLHYIL